MSIRKMSTNCAKSLLYKDYGEPTEVLQVVTQTVDQPARDQVKINITLVDFRSYGSRTTDPLNFCLFSRNTLFLIVSCLISLSLPSLQ